MREQYEKPGDDHYHHIFLVGVIGIFPLQHRGNTYELHRFIKKTDEMSYSILHATKYLFNKTDVDYFAQLVRSLCI